MMMAIMTMTMMMMTMTMIEMTTRWRRYEDDGED